MMKRASFLFCLCVLATTAAYGDSTDPCDQVANSALDQCRSDQQILRQQRLERQLQLQEQRQNQLDLQQREVQRQLDDVRLQNDDLRKQLQQTVSHPAPSAKMDNSKSAEVRSWTAENPWFGSDYPKTEFAVHYAKQLQKDRPDLSGRPLLDALSAKVNETFGAKH